MARIYSLRKSRNVLHWGYKQFQKRENTLSPTLKNQLENNLKELENAIFSGDRVGADRLARRVEEFCGQHFKKTILFYIMEIAGALVIALLIAAVVRQTWFELYEIPSGSMRPTFREQDRLTVTKSAFGLNVPLQTKHFYFDPDLVKRAGVVIFSGDGIPTLDVQTSYFGVIPYTKRYIKRLIGKPGDSLYFYGGMVYGVDKEGAPITELLEDPWMKQVEHVPFLTFEGAYKASSDGKIVFSSMGHPIGRLVYNRVGGAEGEIFTEGKWIKEKPFSENPGTTLQTYGDFWGIGNFAMARLMNREELEKYTSFKADKVGDGVLYLHLKHTPNLSYPPPRLYKEGNYFGVQLPTLETVIPLSQEHLNKLMGAMYTTRFVVKDGRTKGYSMDDDRYQAGNPIFKEIANGTYEFYHGKAKKIGWQGLESSLPESDALYRKDPEWIQALFNMGIDMLTSYDPYTFFQTTFPHRYAYFRDGDFYLMGAPILKKGDPLLDKFVAAEVQKEKDSSTKKPYRAFVDRGAPIKEGKLDTAYIKAFGIKVPEGRYLVLGDNHAVSYDSRFVGGVPQNNLQGAPSLLLWPPGERWGFPPQSGYPLITVPRLIVWGIAGLIFGVWYILRHRRNQTRLF